MAVRRGVLTTGAIVGQGIALADAAGLEAVSMRAIADRLGAGVMSLYRHVPNKERLVELMVDQVMEHYAYPDRAGRTWRENLTTLAEYDWAMYLEHPWVLVATATSRPPVGPNTLRAMEWAYAGIAELGLPPESATGVILAVVSHVQAVALLATAERRHSAESGLDPVHWWRQRLREIGGDRHPALDAVLAGHIEGDPEHWLRFDLELLLDGVERLAERHRR